MLAKNKRPDKIICARKDTSNYSILNPGQFLKPVGGKIYWHVDENTLSTDMDKYKIIFGFEQAFATIQPYIFPITFQSTGDVSQSQITIKFKNNGDAGLPQPFGSGVLAYAYSPYNESFGLNSDVFFNDFYNWQEMHTINGFYLKKVAAHEFLHSVGLGHSQIKDDILYWQYQPNNEIEVTADTQRGLYEMYKAYGVVNPNASTSIPGFIKSLIKTKYDLNRMNSGQVNLIASTLNVTFNANESVNSKINKLFNKILSL